MLFFNTWKKEGNPGLNKGFATKTSQNQAKPSYSDLFTA